METTVGLSVPKTQDTKAEATKHKPKQKPKGGDANVSDT